ncbi:MAG: hypothetical protein ACRDLQ_04815 [Solirubrobacterales bacterium]
MSRAGSLVASVLAGVLIAGCGESERPDRSDAGDRFCVTVTPKRGDTDTMFRFRGRGWIPRREVTATYGVYCRPGRVCILVAKMTRFRADAEGRFLFRFRNGPRPPADIPQPRDSGGGPVTFRQRTGPPGSARFVSRRPPYYVDGRLVGSQ